MAMFGFMFVVAFGVIFAAVWLGVTSILMGMSGWFGLVRRFPDQPGEAALVSFHGQSGTLAAGEGMGVSLRGMMTLEACAGGLRVRVWRVFCPLAANVAFVPYSEMAVSKSRDAWRETATLALGRDGERHLTIGADVADRLVTAG